MIACRVCGDRIDPRGTDLWTRIRICELCAFLMCAAAEAEAGDAP